MSDHSTISHDTKEQKEVVLFVPKGMLDDGKEYTLDGEILFDSFQDLLLSPSSWPQPLDETITYETAMHMSEKKRKITRPTRMFFASHLLCKRKGLVVLRCVAQLSKKKQSGKTKEEVDQDPVTLYFCLKLRYPFSEIQDEVQRFKSMMSPLEENESVVVDGRQSHHVRNISDLFPEFYGFVKFQMPNNEVWGGICMEFYDASAADILYSSYHFTHKKIALKLEKNYIEIQKKQDAKNIMGSTMSHQGTNRGIPIAYIHGRSVYTSLAASCIQILRSLHKFNWVHGDTHLANFLIDADEMRVVLIDTERSFKTSNSIQKLLDIQEVFGHISTLTVSMPYNSSWDMRDVQGVAGLLHPFNSLCKKETKTKQQGASPTSSHETITQILLSYEMSKPMAKIHSQVPERFRHMTPKNSIIFLMLPICNCYARHCTRERIKGCIYCKSEFCRRTAQMLYSDNTTLFDEVMDHFIKASLSTIQIYIQCTRQCIRLNASEIRNYLTTHDYIFEEALKKQIKKSDISYTEFATEHEVDIHDLYIQRLIYLGAFIPNYTKLNQKLIKYLRNKKLDHIAERFQKITLPKFKHNDIYESIAIITPTIKSSPPDMIIPMSSPATLEDISLPNASQDITFIISDSSSSDEDQYDLMITCSTEDDTQPKFAASYTCCFDCDEETCLS